MYSAILWLLAFPGESSPNFLCIALGHRSYPTRCNLCNTATAISPSALHCVKHLPSDGVVVWVQTDLNHVVHGQVSPVGVFPRLVEQPQRLCGVASVPTRNHASIKLCNSCRTSVTELNHVALSCSLYVSLLTTSAARSQCSRNVCSASVSVCH